MGNQLTQPSRLAAAEAVAELGGSLTYKDSLGGGRFFKSSLCVHDEGGLVVVKVYSKGADSPELRPYRDRLLGIHAALAGLDYSHVWPVQRVYESQRAAFLVRQYLHANLAQRITTRPFLTLIEKRWIAYQLLLSLAQCHDRGVCHGDIKAENVALTSWDWAFLVDFAPHKPTLLPADNPADFSFFFDTSGRRKCYLAPERFYDPTAAPITPQQAADAPLTPAMDVFGLGCVLAELFLDGQPLFDYSRLLAYRQGGAAAANALAPLHKVPSSVRGMLAHMVQRDPAKRHSVHQYLQEACTAAVPPYLASTIHPFLASMLHLDTDARITLATREYQHVKAQLLASDAGAAAADDAGGANSGAAPAAPVPAACQSSEQLRTSPSEDGSRAGTRPAMEQAVGVLLADAQASLKRLEGRSGGGSQGGTRRPVLRHSSSITSNDSAAEQLAERHPLEQLQPAEPARSASQPAGTKHINRGSSLEGLSARQLQQPLDQQVEGQELPPVQHEGMVLVAVLLCTLLRGSRLQEHKARVVWLLRDAASHCDDETRLQRVLPYLVAATSEPLAGVKTVALRAVARVLAQVHGVPPSEAKVFNEYVLPCLSLLPSDPELLVQVEYASCITQLAATAQAFLEQLQRRRLQMGASAAGEAVGGAPLLNYDEEMAHLRAGVERVVHDLLVGPHPDTKLALMPHLAQLAAFVGRRDTADVLLPSLLTFFNSHSWQVRAAFYAAFVGVCPSLGADGVAAIVLPFLDRLVGDSEPAVAAEAVAFLAAVARRGLLRQRHLLLVAARLCSPATLALGPGAPTPLRAASLDFLSSAAGQLSDADVHAQLLPLVLPRLAGEPLDLRDAQQVARVLRDREGGATGSLRAARSSRPPVLPVRPGYPPVPPAVHQAFVVSSSRGEASIRRSLDSLATSDSRGGGGASGTAAASCSRSMLLPPPSASTYSLLVEARHLLHASSYLSAAVEQSMMAQAGAGGHLIASNSSRGPQRSGTAAATSSRLHMSEQWGPMDSGQHLVARARRSLPQSASIAQQMRMPAVAVGQQQQQQRGEPAGIAHPTQPAALGGSGGVRDAMSAALAAGMPGGSADGGIRGVQAAPWYPRGVMVAHLAEHRKSVTRLAAAGSGAFFASASADGTVKVWDCRRLEKDVSFRSRLTYSGQAGRINALAACQDSQSMASGSAAGSIHVWRVEYAARAGAPERYTGIVGCRQVSPSSSGVLELQAWSPSLLVYSTQQGGLSAWDLRMGRDAWVLAIAPEWGVVQRFVLDPASHNWLLGGSSRGQLSVWDLRFRLPVNCWQHPAGAPIKALAQAWAPPQRLGLGGASGPLVYVAAGEQEVGLWDVAQAKCLQVLRVQRTGSSEAPSRQVPSALAPPAASLLHPRGLDMMSRARQLAISELQTPQTRREGCRALLPTAGGQLLTGGSDRVVRCWDSRRPQQSYVVCAPPPPIPTAPAAGAAAVADATVDAAAGGAPGPAGGEGGQASVVDVPQYAYTCRSVQGVPVVEESCTLHRTFIGTHREQHLARLGWVERAGALCHQLAVTDMLCVEGSEPLLVSAAADGVIKAWR